MMISGLDAIITFKELFIPIFFALQIFEQSENAEQSKQAFAFLQCIKNANFIVSMIVVHEVFSHAQPVSTALQGKNVDLASAIEMIENLNKILETMRENAQTNFEQHFSLTKTLSSEMDEEIKIPRIARQKHRANYENQTPEDHYRLSVFIPFLDHFISQLHDRFLKHKNVLTKIENMLPIKIVSLSDDEVEKTINAITLQWPDIVNIPENMLKSEALLWKLK